MAGSTDQIDREIAEVRGSIESRIVELRQRGQRRIREYRRIALIGLGVAGGVAVVAVGGYALYRYTRPPSRRERIERLVPAGALRRLVDLARLRQRVELAMRRELPAVRLYVGDHQVGEKPAKPRVEVIAVRAARILGTAAGSALAGNLAKAVTKRRNEAA
ncbi:MAG TPA: hypothetical protein VIA06_12545 [Candidatus Dormibacteraeota bacterium]|jgi:hypothetical protein|nr:hypothetical protein [Candidatus Dormibacteraeota bacterium]